MIANIASDDALILPHRANPAGLNFRERQVMRLAIMRNSMGAGRQKAYNCMVLRANDPHDVEMAMKYVLLGNLSPEYASKQSERVRKAMAKLDKLGIKIESIHYTQAPVAEQQPDQTGLLHDRPRSNEYAPSSQCPLLSESDRSAALPGFS